MSNKYIVMIGSELTSPGGISAVATTYKKSGLFEQAKVKYLASYDKPNKLSMLVKFFICYMQLFRMLMLKKVVCVHVHSASRGSFWRKTVLLQLARFFGVKTIFHLHSGEFKNYYESCSPKIKKYISDFLSQVDIVIALTESWKQVVLEISPRARVEVVYNPVEEIAGDYQKLNNQILFLGRLRDTKGLFELIDACAKLKQQGTEFELVLAGDGDIEDIRQLCAAKGLADVVKLPGWVDGKAKERLLLESDIFVLPSYFEGLPIGVLEAMANKVAVIATDVGGIPDVLTSGQEGLLVKAKDTNKLAEAIKELLQNSELKNRYINNAYHRASQQFTSQSVNAALISLYAQEQS
ncbi:glycosyltransferase family 4 protein [Vibrio tubiashii]|uniref:glycosyltransferase family 4 protein n=1 Tax=Vibrio tubiashii TaxID=29498 RepID=UPI00234EE1E3|nr:glycosyltransferase family 4 protein [Vibrio tubiashii]WCP69985.1 glycosyltransferase family 4 protein [Vibrio tubiashii]